MRKCMKEKLINSFDSPLSIIPSSEDIYNKALKDQEFKKRQNIIDMYLRKYVLPAIEQAISDQRMVIEVPLFKTIISEELQEVVLEVLRKRGYTICSTDLVEYQHKDGGFYFTLDKNPWACARK